MSTLFMCDLGDDGEKALPVHYCFTCQGPTPAYEIKSCL